MSLIKYMGSSDVRVIRAGENFDGRLAAPLTAPLVWDWHNQHVVDTDKLNLSDAAVALIARESGFLDVTGMAIVPLNEAQRMWRGLDDETREPGTLPPGWVDVGALPTSQDMVPQSDVPSSMANEPVPSSEAVEFAHKVNDTPADPEIVSNSADQTSTKDQ